MRRESDTGGSNGRVSKSIHGISGVFLPSYEDKGVSRTYIVSSHVNDPFLTNIRPRKTV